VDKKGETWQRTTLIPLDKDELKDFTPEKIREKLLDEGKTASDIPSDKKLEEWLQNPKYSLHLKGGQPIRFVHKKGGGVGNFKNPVGWSGILHPNGKIDQLRKLDLVNDRLELWVGFDPKKGWQYYKRIIPSKDSMRGLKRLGIPWRGQKGLPEYTVQLLGKKCKDLKVYYCGTLPKYSHKVGEFKLGDTFLIAISEKRQKRQNAEGSDVFKDNPMLDPKEWFKVTSVKKQLELKPILRKCEKGDVETFQDPKKLAVELLGLPPEASKYVEKINKERQEKKQTLLKIPN
jgi:hypothetical protein